MTMIYIGAGTDLSPHTDPFDPPAIGHLITESGYTEERHTS